MRACWLAALACVAVVGTPARAANSGRLDLLAAEATRLTAEQGPEDAFPAPWGAIAALAGGTILAAFLGTYAAARRRSPGAQEEDDEDCSELTYRFRSAQPLRFKQDTLARLNGLLRDLEEIGPEGGTAGAAPYVQAPGAAASPSEEEPSDLVAPEPEMPSPEDCRGAYARARRLLESGHDTATIRELTGVNPEKLSPAPAGARP